ncbi:hypothetical protein [Polynucleobacter asymbioticus]|jgi:RsiW-degrading membrane proteinase PrsW (M82 family)|uniref:DUF4239 domain-containing protein n=1 Tax=Polynucleobacter asymbioticus TaxID=576611 RepID=A0AAC9NI78_9BURK|nr:hypothetical protein [Polynucleobacter asymbioticus]APB98178.1 hypothetical protein A4F89_01915 [Polynucleobacter asymbioticus]APC00464.1 hypothetical protein AOC25_01920 [Polynucleobacter asymbioticus]
MSSLINSNLQLLSLVPLALTFSIFVSTAVGWYFGRSRLKKHGKDSIVVRDFLVTAIFGLSALVLGLTFSGSTSRYVSRMDMNRIQAQTLQEVYGSLKYLSPSDQVEIKRSLNELVALRLTIYKNINDISDLEVGSKKILNITRKIQEQVTEAVSRTSPNNKLLAQEVLIPQVRSLASSFFTGIINAKSHPPELLMRFLFALLCIGAFLIGYTMVVKNEIDWLLATLYTVLVGFSLYVILAMEAPNLLMPYEEMNRDFLLLHNTIKAAS